VRCPQCQKHLRFDPDAAQRKVATSQPFRVEGTIRAPEKETWEYNLIVSVRDARGQELARHLVAVGALAPTDARTVVVSVEATTVQDER
jgi:hypothetical protein